MENSLQNICGYTNIIKVYNNNIVNKNKWHWSRPTTNNYLTFVHSRWRLVPISSAVLRWWFCCILLHGCCRSPSVADGSTATAAVESVPCHSQPTCHVPSPSMGRTSGHTSSSSTGSSGWTSGPQWWAWWSVASEDTGSSVAEALQPHRKNSTASERRSVVVGENALGVKNNNSFV